MKKIPFGTKLLVLAVLPNLARWVGAFLLTENPPAWVINVMPYLGIMAGFSMGLVMAGGLAFVFHGISRLQPLHIQNTKNGKSIRPNMRFWLPGSVGIVILILSVFLLSPYVVTVMDDDFKSNLANPQLWAGMTVLVADLIIVAISALGDKATAFTHSSKPQAEGSKPQAGKSKSQAEKNKTKRGPCRYCKTVEIAQSTNGYNAHRAKCTASEKWPPKKNISLAENLFDPAKRQ